jgi:hypothetical protein
MLHSRPGFKPRKSDAAPAKLQDDMVPAIHRGAAPKKEPHPISLEARLAAHKADHQHAGTDHTPPQVLVNPAPSATPQVNEPGK